MLYDIVQVILEVCENAVNYRDEKGRTVLHYACAEGSTDCVRTLISAHRYILEYVYSDLCSVKLVTMIIALCVWYSCDIHSRDNRGTTPLHWAAAANQPSIIQLLLRSGYSQSMISAFFHQPNTPSPLPSPLSPPHTSDEVLIALSKTMMTSLQLNMQRSEVTRNVLTYYITMASIDQALPFLWLHRYNIT